MITKLFPLFPSDFNRMLLDQVSYDLEKCHQDALNRSLADNILARRKCWVLRIIFKRSYQFWYGIFILMIIPLSIWFAIGWSLILAWVITTLLIAYPFIFNHLIQDLIDFSYGYKRYQKFLDDYHFMIIEVIRDQRV